MTQKITKNVLDSRIKVFTDAVIFYQNLFNLMNWEICIERHDEDDARASAYFGTWEDGQFNSGRIANVCYSMDWISSKDLTDYEIKQTAFHEVIEVLLANLRIYSENNKYVISETTIDEEIHSIIRTFENKIFPLIESGIKC